MILTIGHSRHPLTTFLETLSRHGVQAIADVRRKPYSRRQPQYNREALAAALTDAGFEYSHYETLGGLREPHPDSPHIGLPPALRGFGDYMETEAFRSALVELIERSKRHQVAILCAEASPDRCHRSLVADALVALGVEVEHILDTQHREPHRLGAGVRIADDRLLYDGRQANLDLGR